MTCGPGGGDSSPLTPHSLLYNSNWSSKRTDRTLAPEARNHRGGTLDRDTDIGGPDARLPATRHSVIEAVASGDPEVRRRAFDILIAAYWKPVYKHVRIKWRADNEDAKDLTQEFFARAMEKGFFDRYDPARARFRTFLRTCLDGFVANQRKAAQRLKRGGEATILSLDFEAAEGELRRIDVPDDADPDDQFRREWVRSLFGFAVDTLRVALAASGKNVYFDLFRRYDLEEDEGGARPTYGDLAKEFGISSSQVTNYLAYARREFRRIVLERLRTLSATDEDFREEARELFGMDPS
jgi:RNA polymerase sigma factor (sigma-70 family)